MPNLKPYEKNQKKRPFFVEPHLRHWSQRSVQQSSTGTQLSESPCLAAYLIYYLFVSIFELFTKLVNIFLLNLPAIPNPLHPAASTNVVMAAVGSLINAKQHRNNASPPKPVERKHSYFM